VNQSTIIKATESWLNVFIIGQKICPFASRPYENKQISYQVYSGKDIHDCLQDLITECRRMDDDGSIETTLLILADLGIEFDYFLDLLALAEQLLTDQGYEGVYQLASFHPQYCFADSDPDDPANYTNRSPYPMLHIIREASIELALQSYPDAELIPERNIALLRKLGTERIRALLAGKP
jgi:uncharacterized protein